MARKKKEALAVPAESPDTPEAQSALAPDTQGTPAPETPETPETPEPPETDKPKSPPLGETADDVSSATNVSIPARKNALSPHVDAVERMGLGMLRFALAAALCPLALLGSPKVSEITVGDNPVAFAIVSGSDLAMAVEYDVSPMQLDEVAVVAPDKSNGTSVVVKRRRPYGLPYIESVTYEEYGRARPPLGSYDVETAPAIWHAKAASADSTGMVWRTTQVVTNYVYDAAEGKERWVVSTNDYVSPSAIQMSRLSLVSGPTGSGYSYPFGRDLLATPAFGTYDSRRIAYSVDYNALGVIDMGTGANDTNSVPVAEWTRLGGITNRLFQFTGAYTNRTVVYCRDWRDGPFEWIETNGTWIAVRGGESVATVSKYLGNANDPSYGHEAAKFLFRPLEAVLGRSWESSGRWFDPSVWRQPAPSAWLDAPAQCVTYEDGIAAAWPRDAFPVLWAVPSHKATYVANWGSKSGTVDEVLATVSLTGNVGRVAFDRPVSLLKGDVLYVSSGIASNDAFRVTFTGRR